MFVELSLTQLLGELLLFTFFFCWSQLKVSPPLGDVFKRRTSISSSSFSISIHTWNTVNAGQMILSLSLSFSLRMTCTFFLSRKKEGKDESVYGLREKHTLGVSPSWLHCHLSLLLASAFPYPIMKHRYLLRDHSHSRKKNHVCILVEDFPDTIFASSNSQKGDQTGSGSEKKKRQKKGRSRKANQGLLHDLNWKLICKPRVTPLMAKTTWILRDWTNTKRFLNKKKCFL